MCASQCACVEKSNDKSLYSSFSDQFYKHCVQNREEENVNYSVPRVGIKCFKSNFMLHYNGLYFQSYRGKLNS